MEEERLQKYLANSGIASRRKCEEFILDGKVVTELGTKVIPGKDIVTFNRKKSWFKRKKGIYSS